MILDKQKVIDPIHRLQKCLFNPLPILRMSSSDYFFKPLMHNYFYKDNAKHKNHKVVVFADYHIMLFACICIVYLGYVEIEIKNNYSSIKKRQ
jgi:hypothetical protein